MQYHLDLAFKILKKIQKTQCYIKHNIALQSFMNIQGSEREKEDFHFDLANSTAILQGQIGVKIEFDESKKSIRRKKKRSDAPQWSSVEGMSTHRDLPSSGMKSTPSQK